MTFLELRSAIVSCINQSKNLTPEEIYGVIASVEAEVRLGLMSVIRIPQETQE